MSLLLAKDVELIAGYQLIERVGAGGYGEVWTANAPGGLKKAIKIVYGYLDGRRAAVEMKAIERIKQVRHPFLLSLERIEIIEDQLVIVMELADTSVHDRYRTCTSSGLPGIPRDELLNYIRDTADALDFLSDHHSLQHLDVKPENLLLVGGHIKVADFGLVQGFDRNSISLLGGLTPQYAPPELFMGRPSRYSDQYSLAVLYVELLTSQLPFAGDDLGELTQQHMNEQPHLSMLPPADERVIARALSKQPAERFTSCSEMVLTLLGTHPEVVVAAPIAPSGEDGDGSKTEVLAESEKETVDDEDDADWLNDSFSESDEQSKTLVLDDEFVEECEPQEQRSLPVFDFPTEVTHLPPLASDNEYAIGPALFLGVGGTAGHVLQNLKHQINEHGGGLKNSQHFQVLLLDSDSQSLGQFGLGSEGEALTPEERLALRLRRPQDYRAGAKNLLRWLGRRWIYNVPKSMRTEGLRPLGRLALVDHSSRAFQRIRHSIRQITDPETLSQATDNLKISFDAKRIRVYVVASISGGTGSGMVTDIGYAVRMLLAKQGVDAEVIGLLTHSTSRVAGNRELSVVNAFTCLKELRHFFDPDNAFPGDASCGLPPFPADTPPFDHLYLVDLGGRLNEQQWIQGAHGLGDYLYLDACTPSTSFFQGRRSNNADDPVSRTRLRSLGVRRIKCLSDEMLDQASREICRQVADSWRQGDALKDGAVSPHLKNAAKQLRWPLSEVSLTIDQMLQKQLTRSGELLRKLLAEQTGAGAEPYVQAAAKLAKMLDVEQPVDAPMKLDVCLEGVLEAPIRRLAAKAASEVQRHVIEMLDDPQGRLPGAQYLAQSVDEHFTQLVLEAGESLCRTSRELVRTRTALQEALTAEKELSEANLSELLAHYLHLACLHVNTRGAAQLATCVSASIRMMSEQLHELQRELRSFADSFTVDEVVRQDDHSYLPLQKAALQAVKQRQSEVCSRMDRLLHERLLKSQGGILEIMTSPGDQRRQVSDAMLKLSRQLLQHVLQSVDAAAFLLKQGQNGDVDLDRLFSDVSPRLLELGGAKSLLLAMPTNRRDPQTEKVLRRRAEGRVELGSSACSDILLCCEAEGLRLPQVAVHLIEHRADLAELAERLHTRVDISWQSLTEPTLEPA